MSLITHTIKLFRHAETFKKEACRLAVLVSVNQITTEICRNKTKQSPITTYASYELIDKILIIEKFILSL